jgi:signal transduction histidine kinase
MQLRQFDDGAERMVSLKRLPRYGVNVVLTRDLHAILLPWRQTALAAVVGAALLLGTLLGSVAFIQKSDRRRAEAQQALQTQLARASKLESLGTLAGGVAHDFNNVLASIIGYGEMAQDAAQPGSSQARQLDNVMKAALRGKAVVERILAFSRGGAGASTIFELEPVVNEVLQMLAASLKPGIVVERRFDAAGARLRGEPTLVFEAVMNLCTNAMQAMPAGGMLSVRLDRVKVQVPRALSHSKLSRGDFVVLTIADEGHGITPQVMERLFEPFFTTREPGAGTGLGLSVVHGVVSTFGGAIDVGSEPGRGARFTLYLPECNDAEKSASAPTGAPRGNGESILVVDDEHALVEMAQETLRVLGYQPVGFTDPLLALREVRDNAGRYAAVITDEVMPGLSGTQFTEEIRAVRHDLPVLLVSGYGGTLLAARAAAVGITRVLPKPVRREELARALADVLH